MLEFLAGAAFIKFLCGGSSRRESTDERPPKPEWLSAIALVQKASVIKVANYVFDRNTRIRVIARTSAPVDVLFMFNEDADKFIKNEACKCFMNLGGVDAVDEKYTVTKGLYSLVVVNRDQKDVAVSYEVRA